MNSKPVSALGEVVHDLIEASAHYQSWRSDGKEHILAKYQETLNWIAWNPDLFPRVFGHIQRAILKQSYYIIYFLQEPNRTLVLAVLDGRRKPLKVKNILGTRKHRH